MAAASPVQAIPVLIDETHGQPRWSQTGFSSRQLHTNFSGLAELLTRMGCVCQTLTQPPLTRDPGAEKENASPSLQYPLMVIEPPDSSIIALCSTFLLQMTKVAVADRQLNERQAVRQALEDKMRALEQERAELIQQAGIIKKKMQRLKSTLLLCAALSPLCRIFETDHHGRYPGFRCYRQRNQPCRPAPRDTIPA